MRRNQAIIFGLVLFPVAIMALSMGGFAFGRTIGKWQLPIAFALTQCAVYFFCHEQKWKAVVWTSVLIFAAVFVAALPMMYTNADAEHYHRPAAVLLANGWNPLRITEVNEVKCLMGGGFGAWHVAFLPRMGWVFGAVLYQWLGFIEVADAFNFILLFASLFAVHEWLAERFTIEKRICRLVLTVAMCFSPVVVQGAFSGSVDSGLYSAFLVAVCAARLKSYATLSLAVIAMSGVKFTGVVVGGLIFAVHIAEVSVFDRRNVGVAKGFIQTGILTAFLVFLINASPYLTSLKNHGGPFYPSHSFVTSETFANEDNPITRDFGFMNDDARQIGYFGRFCWGYVSQALVRKYYATILDRPDFNPDFRVNNGVGGFGGFFRAMFVLSLIAWPFVRKREITVLMGLILTTVLIQPTFYSGYARYVPQFFLFPILAMLGLSERYGRQKIVAMLAGGYSIAHIAYPLSWLAIQWIVSVQNLQIIEAARQSSEVHVAKGGLYSRHSLLNDYGIKGVYAPKAVDRADGFGSYFGFYSVLLPNGIEGFHNLHHVRGGNDANVKSSRNANLVRFFVKEFLPDELPRLPLRLWQTLRIRGSQLKRMICPYL